jgi:hypothetical protein
LLSREVLDSISEKPFEKLPDAMWRGLSPAQRAMVQEVRRLAQDGFEQAAGKAQPAPEPVTPFAGTDPIAGTAPAPDPVTGLDPTAMRELFGAVVDTKGLEKFEGEELLHQLRDRFFVKHVALDYTTARRHMFGEIDNEGGKVHDVYADRTFPAGRIPDADGPNGFNTEHTWPQSKLKEAGKHDAISDLHHLFPVEAFANGKRGHVPFGWVKTVEWENGVSKLGRDAKGQVVFTPPEIHRGNVARAMFWIATAYELDIPPDEEAVLREWAKTDPVDPHELKRTQDIAKVQGDANPFVLHPELADKVKDF